MTEAFFQHAAEYQNECDRETKKEVPAFSIAVPFPPKNIWPDDQPYGACILTAAAVVLVLIKSNAMFSKCGGIMKISNSREES